MTLRPRSGDRLPIAMFDTRRTSSALRDIPAKMSSSTADRPGTEPLQQTWQVLSADTRLPGRLFFGIDDSPTPGGAGSGAVTNGPAGNVSLNLNAGSSPIFLLLDGGKATGQLSAGRLGVRGLPGAGSSGSDRAVDLTGVLNGNGGGSGAQFGRVTATDPGEQSSYRFNNCVIGSINCVVFARAQPLLIPTVRELTFARPNFIDSEVILPNVSAEDEQEDN
jgi:hypothetical protein